MVRKKEVLTDYWDKKIPITMPGQSIIASAAYPPSLGDPERAIRKALEHPIGAPSLVELAKGAKRGKVVIAHDDPNRPGMARRIIITMILEILNRAGIPDDNVYLLSANGNHPKWPDTTFKEYYGKEIYERFRSPGSVSRILNHDCHDPYSLIYLGASEMNDYVECNSLLEQADLFIYLGTIVSTNWGGYTGTGAAIGLASSRSILSTHGYDVVNNAESCHGDPRTMLFRRHKQSIMEHIEKTTGKRVFYVDAVLGAEGHLAAVFSGYSPEINRPTWDYCDRHFAVEVPQADVFILGVPKYVSYGETSNPLISLAFVTTPPRIWRNKHLLKEGGVIIALVRCNGYIDERAHPSYKEALHLYRQCHSTGDMTKFEDEFYNREDLIFKYRFCRAYAPIHPFFLLYESQYMLDRAGKIIFAGTPGAEVANAPPQVEGPGGPGAVRDIGCVPARDFDEAWGMTEKIVGRNPTVVASPQFWTASRPVFFVK
jgi:nickel-dependent lactate racemase